MRKICLRRRNERKTPLSCIKYSKWKLKLMKNLHYLWHHFCCYNYKSKMCTEARTRMHIDFHDFRFVCCKNAKIWHHLTLITLKLEWKSWAIGRRFNFYCQICEKRLSDRASEAELWPRLYSSNLQSQVRLFRKQNTFVHMDILCSLIAPEYTLKVFHHWRRHGKPVN